MSTTHVNQIRQQQRELLAELDTQRADHAQRALDLVQDPTDPDHIEALELSASRVEALQKRLAIFEAAINGAKSKDQQTAVAARLRTAFESVEQAKALCVKREAAAAQVDKAIAKLGEALDSFSALSSDISDCAHTAAKAVIAADDNLRTRKLLATASAARPGIGSSLAAALMAAGVGTAVSEGASDPLAGYTNRTCPQWNLAELAAMRSSKLAEHLEKMLKGV